MRTFISIDPPAALRQSIRSCCPQFKSLRLMPAEQLHLTLLFLGEQPHTIRDSVSRAFTQLSQEPFRVQLRGIGQFSSGVIWLGVDSPQPLLQFQQRLSYALQLQGVLFEQRNFHPHLTLGRSRKPLTQTQIGHFSEAFCDKEFSFTLLSARLKQSKLYSTGAVHTTLDEWFLA